MFSLLLGTAAARRRYCFNQLFMRIFLTDVSLAVVVISRNRRIKLNRNEEIFIPEGEF